MISFDQFKANWTGNRVNPDGVYGFQCVDLILQYVRECFGINAGVSGNAIDYWNKTGVGGFNQALLSMFSKVHTSEVQKGDIVVLLGADPDGHVGIATGNLNATEVEILEQNGGGGGDGLAKPGGVHWDEIGTRWVSRSHVVGVLRPHTLPAAGPAQVAPVSIPYTNLNQPVTVTADTLMVRSGPGTNYPHGQANTPDGSLHKGNSAEITGWVHAESVNNNDVWLRSIAGHWFWSGGTNFNMTQVIPVPAPAPVPEPAPLPPPPAVIASTPVIRNPNPSLPTGALRAPSTETYELIVDVPGYLSSNQAINHISPKVTVPVGTYYIFNRRLPALNITKTPGQPGAWINPADNTVVRPLPPAPEPEPVAAAPAEPFPYTAFDKPILFMNVSGHDLQVVDHEGKHKTATIHYTDVTWLSGTFEHNGIEYGRPQSAADKSWWYGITMVDPTYGTPNMEKWSEVHNSQTTLEERQVTKTLRPSDHFQLAYRHTQNFVLPLVQFLSKIKAALITK